MWSIFVSELPTEPRLCKSASPFGDLPSLLPVPLHRCLPCIVVLRVFLPCSAFPTHTLLVFHRHYLQTNNLHFQPTSSQHLLPGGLNWYKGGFPVGVNSLQLPGLDKSQNSWVGWYRLITYPREETCKLDNAKPDTWSAAGARCCLLYLCPGGLPQR
jgi:hypothetical protein